MIDTRTGKDLKEYPVLEDGRIYIYVMIDKNSSSERVVIFNS